MKAFLIALVALLIIDPIYLSLMSEFYAKHYPEMRNVNIPFAILVWVLLAIGIAVFVDTSTLTTALWQGALFGFVVYGVYNFTNVAIFAGFAPAAVAVDIIWGSVLSAGVSAIVHFL